MSASAQKGAANTLESSIAGTFVCTASCKAADDAFRMMMIGSSAVGGLALLIVGESGVGKTTLLDAFYRGLEPVRTAEGWVRPCLRIQVPTSPTAISLFEALLDGLGDPRPSKGTRSQKKARVLLMLHQQKVRVLFLDELQHFYDRESERVLFDASEALKEILSLYPVAVVCAGLKQAELVVRSNEQLKRRHMRTVRLPRYDWRERASRNAFRGVLRGFAKKLQQYDTPDFESEEMALRLFLATGGIMDFVAKIFIFSEIIARQRKMAKITLDLLSEAWQAVLLHAGEAAANPFTCDLAMNLDEKIAAALRINHAVVVSSVAKRRKRKKSKSEADEVLRLAGL